MHRVTANDRIHMPRMQASPQHIPKALLTSLQAVIEDSFADGNEASALAQASSLPTRPHSQHAVPLTEDPSDDFCRVCGFGVSSPPVYLEFSDYM